MQAVCAVAKPFAASGARAPRSSSSRAAVVRAAVAGEPEQQPLLARRSVAGLLAAAPVLLPASRALALIPDDDDEELVQKARANRQARLASERQAEQAFSRSARGLGAWRCRQLPSLHAAKGCTAAAEPLPCVDTASPRQHHASSAGSHQSAPPTALQPHVCRSILPPLLQTACWSRS